MPYKLVGNCVHKYNPDTKKVGAVVAGGCHKSRAEALAHQRALYANVKKEADMSNSRKQRKMRSSKVTPEEILKAEEELEDEVLLELEEDEPLTDEELALLDEDDVDGEDEIETEVDESEKEYKSSDLVYDILQTSDEIRKSANDLVERNTEKAEIDLDLLELEAIIAKDNRDITLSEQVGDWLSKAKLSYGARKKLSSSSFALPSKRKYPIQDKAHVRNALARAAQQIKAGGEGAKDAKAALPKIRAAAKKFGIGQMKKEFGGILIEKDANGDWRWVGYPTNNFKDRSQDIITEAAHQDYVDWVNKDLPNRSPVFTSCHAPGTARENTPDFVAYENGFVVMSGKLTDVEAEGLMKSMTLGDVGMSHTGWGLRNPGDAHLIEKYRSFEITDLPLETADNPFTNDFDVYSKEVDMTTQLEHLTALLGSKEKAEAALSLKTSLKQKELQEAKVESKETPEEKVEAPAAPHNDELVKQIAEALEIDALSEFVEKANVAFEEIEALKTAVTALTKEQDEALAEKISPPAMKFAWSKQRSSQNKETLLKEDDKDDKELEKAAPEMNWLNQITHTTPITETQPQ